MGLLVGESRYQLILVVVMVMSLFGNRLNLIWNGELLSAESDALNALVINNILSVYNDPLI